MRELLSDNGRFTAIQQDDGNFVVYEGNTPVWSMFHYKSDTINNPTPNNPPTPTVSSGPSGNPVKIASGVNPIGMSYWRNINNHSNKDYLNIVLSINDDLTLFFISKNDLSVSATHSLGIHHTGEGINFSAIDSNILFIGYENLLYKLNISNGNRETVWDVGGNKLWQCHTSYDERVHSGTLRDSNYKDIAWVVLDNGRERRFDLRGNEPDECQITRCGDYLLIKEDNYNRIIGLRNGQEITIQNEQGALGHSDCGFGFAIGENDYSPAAGALDRINFTNMEKQLIYSTGIWNMGYVSHTNARPNGDNQFCLITTPDDLIHVRFDGSKQGRKVCSNLAESQKYEHRPKANLCPLGEYAIWTAFVGGQVNAYIVRI